MSTTITSLPDTYSGIPTQELIEIYALGPERLNQVLKGLSVAQLKERAQPAKWSVQEIALHLADAELLAAVRVRQVISQPGTTLPVYEQDIWAAEIGYQNLDSKAFFSAIMMFDSLRLNTSKIFRRVSDSDWQKTGVHPELGNMSLRQLLEIYADHGERHIGQILKLRQLMQVPLDFPLLLNKRLY